MSGRKVRREPPRRYNAVDVAELRRLARWYEGIADDYEAATGTTNAPGKLGDCSRGAREARRWAAQLRAKVADR